MKLTVEEIRSVIEKAEKQIEELQALLSTVEVEPGRTEHGGAYWYTDNAGLISTEIESGSSLDEHRYNNGNYYLSSREMRKTEKKALLLRLLDRFSRQNGWTDELWKNSIIEKYYIYFDYNYKSIETESVHICRHICQVYFISESITRQAIEKYHDLIMEVMAI